MSTSYPSELTGTTGTNHGAFYPHSMNVLSPMQANFQMMQSPTGEALSEPRSTVVHKAMSETHGTPLRQANSSSINMGNGSDMSPTSPYRIMTTTSAEAMASSPYKMAEPSAGLSASENVQAAIASFPPLQPGANSSIIRVEGNVIYSSQPLTAADFAPPMMQTSASMFQPQMGGFSQFPPMSASFNPAPVMSFPPAFPQTGTGFMSASPMTPRLLMNQQLTPRGFPGATMGLTPRSFQDTFPTANVIPTHISADPAMMMFAETFRNQCVAMSQYYAAHPEEAIDSPKSVKSTRDTAQPLFRQTMLRKHNAASSLKTIPDQENYDTANQTPTEADKPHKTDDVMDLLNQLVGEDGEEEDKPAHMETETRQQHVESPVMRAPESWTQTLLKKFACGTRAH